MLPFYFLIQNRLERIKTGSSFLLLDAKPKVAFFLGKNLSERFSTVKKQKTTNKNKQKTKKNTRLRECYNFFGYETKRGGGVLRILVVFQDRSVLSHIL